MLKIGINYFPPELPCEKHGRDPNEGKTGERALESLEFSNCQRTICERLGAFGRVRGLAVHKAQSFGTRAALENGERRQIASIPRL
jgi:hypothetical protein